ncbi:NfeD family protein [Halioglobus maricola]|uniref:NfeD family protein n=1 Tax=Halioglobus maricola TaxID=2601894 RepID=A0A5P9NMS3_9GAMM|nr:NfeD family protein [Halioglobus maricola]QFU76795.1 NfeD family protein [Halioglobus maricola]
METSGFELWHLWLIVGAVLLTAEILVPGFVLAGLGFAAMVAGIAQLITGSTGWALAAFSAGALVFFFGIRPLALKTFMDDKPSPFGVNAMIGKRVTISDSPDMGGDLQTTFRDTHWNVQSADDLMEGDEAEIIEVKSTVLVVKRINR